MAASTEWPQRLEVTGSDARHDGVYEITSQRVDGKPVWAKVGRPDIKIKAHGNSFWELIADSVDPCELGTLYFARLRDSSISACNGKWVKRVDRCCHGGYHRSLQITVSQHRDPRPPQAPKIIDGVDEKEQIEISELGDELSEIKTKFEDWIRVYNQSGHQLSDIRTLLNSFIQKYNGMNGGHGQQVDLIRSMLEATGLTQALDAVRTEDEADCRRLSQDRDRLEGLTECKICYSEKRGIVFFPCAHFVTCITCSGQLNRCPICRKNIESRHRVHVS